jgi:hypothetical protein
MWSWAARAEREYVSANNANLANVLPYSRRFALFVDQKEITMRQLATRIVPWLVVLIVLAACAAPAPQVVRNAEVAAPAVAPSAGRPAASLADGADKTAYAPADTERMIVRTADLSLVVTDTGSALQSVSSLVTGLGGYVADSKAWRQGEQLRATVKLRLPAGQLDSALASIKKLAVRVERENIGGQDVTEEYSDLGAQLTNLEATERELRELLAEVRQRTQKAEDILQVYRELTTIRGEIERVKGRLQYLDNLTDMATVSVELVPDVLAKPVVEPGWRPLETLKNAGRTLVNALKGLVDVLIYLIVLVLPVLVVVGGILFLLIKGLQRLTRGRRTK